MAKRRTTEPTVIKRRRAAHNRLVWPERFAKLLGKIPDLELARRSGIGAHLVAREWKRRGIPACKPIRARVEWCPEIVEALGTEADARVAARFGLATSSVAVKRRLLGIPAANPKAKPGKRGFDWSPRAIPMLGTASGQDVAAALGLAASSVSLKRRLLGIPSLGPAAERVEWTTEMLEALGTMSVAAFCERFCVSHSTVQQ